MKTRQKIRFGIITTSLFLFPLTLYYMSPVISLEGASKGIITGSMIVFGLLFAAAILLGRSFCGWLCPAGGLQDVVGLYRSRPVRAPRIRWIKYLIWAPWLSGILLFLRRSEGVQQVDFAYATEGGLSVTSVPGLIAYLSVVLVFFLLAVTIGKRAACHTICWMAPFMIIGRYIGRALRIPSLGLKVTETPCRHCGRCTASCPMSIPVEKGVEAGAVISSDCIICGSCVDTCPAGLLRYSFGPGAYRNTSLTASR